MRQTIERRITIGHSSVTVYVLTNALTCTFTKLHGYTGTRGDTFYPSHRARARCTTRGKTMGRKSNRPTFTTATVAVLAMLDPTNTARLTLWGRSGNERAHLTAMMWESNPACSWCGLDTVLSSHKGAVTACLSLVVSSSLIPDNGNLRCGYVGGNLILACTACSDARGTAVRRGVDTLPVPASVLARADEWTTLPVLDRTYRLGIEGSAVLGMIERASEAHREEAREARQEAGLEW